MHKAFKYRLYPNKAQAEAMEQLLEVHRRLYNAALAERKDVYEAEGRTVTHYEQNKTMARVRREHPELTGMANQNSLQRTLKRLDLAFQAFFRRVKAGEKPGYPRFRGYGRFDSVTFTYPKNGAKLLEVERRVYFMNVGNVKIKLHRPVEGIIKTATFKKEAGKWYAVFSCDLPDPEVIPSTNPEVGIDMGLKAFLVTSGGESVQPPKYYQKAQQKLRRVQRAVSRKKRGGANRKKAVQNLSRLHAHVRNKRTDFHHKTARDMVDRFGLIAHESLNVKGMVRGNLAKSINDAGWSSFLTILGHKAEWAGVRVVAVDARQTTQTCSSCGGLPPEPIGLSVRKYSCVHCGYTGDRDHNAALNILARAKDTARTGPLGANQSGCAMDCPRITRA